jgi:hypothetical protein
MPPHHERVIQLACPPQLAFDLAQQAMVQIGLKIENVDLASASIQASKGAKLIALRATYGHRVLVQLQSSGPLSPNQSVLSIYSESKGPAKVDYGLNKKIAEEFERELTEQLRRSAASGDVERSRWRPSV